MAENTSVVISALVANLAIALLKFGGFALTGSPAMLSETYHSLSDTGNQVFLLIGIRYSDREPDRRHPFGYGKAQFFYSFLVSVLLFGIAGWESLKEGYHAIVDPSVTEASGASLLGIHLTGTEINYLILIAAICFEGYALRNAYREITRQMDEKGWESIREAFKKTSDTSTLTALTEDSVAVAGVGVALVGVFLSEETGNSIFDAASAFVIGLLLMGFAVALAWENKRLLLGESLPADEERRLRELITDAEDVDRIVDFRTVYFGPEHVILTADIEFDPDLDTDRIDERITAIENEIIDAEPAIEKIYIEPET